MGKTSMHVVGGDKKTRLEIGNLQFERDVGIQSYLVLCTRIFHIIAFVPQSVESEPNIIEMDKPTLLTWGGKFCLAKLSIDHDFKHILKVVTT